MRQESAEAFALQALVWLLSQEDLLPQFLSASGAAAHDLHALAQDPVFLGAVLDFVLGDDAMVLALSAALPCAPELPLQARTALPGGAGPHWT